MNRNVASDANGPVFGIVVEPMGTRNCVDPVGDGDRLEAAVAGGDPKRLLNSIATCPLCVSVAGLGTLISWRDKCRRFGGVLPSSSESLWVMSFRSLSKMS